MPQKGLVDMVDANAGGLNSNGYPTRNETLTRCP